MAHDVFISFSFKDQEIADKVSNQLTNMYNIPCWICNAGIRGGSRFYADIVRAIRAAKIFLLVQTKNSVVSKEVVDEILEAIHNQEVKIIPFVLEDSDLNDLDIDDEDQKLTVDFKLRGIQRVDGRKDPLDDRIKELAQELCRVLGRPFESTESKSEKSEYILSPNLVEPATDDIFIGRDALMDEIHTSFERHNTVFLQGMGGIGKSELAKQYYYKYKANESEGYYNKVVFARYDGDFAALIADDLVFNIKGVQRKKDANDELWSDEKYAFEKIKILKNICDSRTLFIIDNFDVDAGDEKLFANFIDKAPYRVLVTTRNLQSNYKSISVKELDDESLKSIFIKYFGEDDGRVSRDDSAFTDLFEWTDRHTLTIELIAKNMKNSRRIPSIGNMLDTIRDKHLAVFWENQKHQGQKSSYDRISDILRMTNLNDDELYFLRCLSLMSPVGIGYVDSFEKWIKRDGDEELYWEKILDRLCALSIVKENKRDGTIYLHPIIREVIINELKPEYQNCKAFLDEFANGIGEGKSWNWSLDKKKAVTNCGDEIISLIELDNETYHLFYSISILKNFVQEYDQVMSLHNRLYNFARNNFGEGSFQTALVAFRAGWYCKKLLLLNEAQVWLEDRAYPVLKGSAQDAIKEYPHCCTNLATLYLKKFELENNNEYLSYVERYIDEADRTTYESYNRVQLENNASLTRTMYARIAGVRMEQAELSLKCGEYDAAQKALEEANKIITSYSDNGADLAYLTSKFATMYYLMGDYTNAIVKLEMTNKLYEKMFSGANDYLLNVYIMLSECYEKVKDQEKALQAWQKAHEIAVDSLVAEHPLMKKIIEHITLHNTFS